MTPEAAYPATFKPSMSRLESELRHSQHRLRQLAARLDRIREEESARIAREIHDHLGQELTSLKLGLEMLLTGLGDRADLQENVRRLVGVAETSIRTVRELCRELRPPLLDEIGIAAAIENHLEEFSRRTDIEHRLRLDVEIGLQSPAVATALFRILQEALTNVARHARSRRVDVLLKKEESKIVLEVHDDGIGVSRAALSAPKSLGLLGMKERALAVGGTLKIQGKAGKGTRVRVTVPSR